MSAFGFSTQWELDACVDCLMWVANGETDPGWTDADRADFLARIADRWTGYRFAVGDGDGGFSTRRCDLCGTHLAGDRHSIVATEMS
jgi:hypothetical protein